MPLYPRARFFAFALCIGSAAVSAPSLAASHLPPGLYFPIGIYSAPSNAFPLLKQVGFNVVVGPAEQSYLDAAQRAGLKVLARIDSLSPKSKFIPKLNRHPALWAWYLADEPDQHLVPPVELESRRKSFRHAGARKPTALTIYQGYEALNYGAIPDLLMVDRYPVPWLPLANFGQHLQMARLGLGPDKPLLAVMQAFDWSAYPELLPGQAGLRPPDFQELRCMAYDALARGVNGLFFYEYEGSRWRIREHPEVWDAVVALVGEMNQRLPLFQARPQWWPKVHDFADPQTRFNAALESSVTSTLLRVTKDNSVVPAGRYILAVNNTTNQLTYRFLLPPFQDPQLGGASPVRVLGENRSVPPAANWLSDSFAPYAVHIYGPLLE